MWRAFFKIISLGGLYVYFLGFLLLFSCATVQVQEIEPPLLQEGEKLFSEGKFSEAEKKILEFQEKNPTSRFFQSSRLTLGQIYEKQDNLNFALEIYEDIIERNQKLNPEMSALARYRKSFVFEKSGNLLKALTILLDLRVENNGLPAEVGALELPGRIALLYSKLGQFSESQKIIDNLSLKIETEYKKKFTNSELAASYFLMGQLSVNGPNNYEDFEAFAQGFQVASLFLLKAIESKVPPWSTKAQAELSQQMDLYWKWVTQVEFGGIEKSFKEKGRRSTLNRQMQMAQKFLSALNEIDLLSPQQEEKLTEDQKKVLSDIDKYQKQAQILLISRTETNELTDEYLKRNGIKREGRLIPVPKTSK